MAKKSISPSQGLLLLMDHYVNDTEHLAQLKRYFLLGANNDTDYQHIIEELKDPVLDNYLIDYSPESISNDATRRYFETHLAHWTLKYGIEQLDVAHLQAYNQAISSVVSQRGENAADIMMRFSKEYLLFQSNVDDRTFIPQITSAEDRHALRTILNAINLSCVMSYIDGNKLPIAIYDQDYYVSDRRGKSPRKAESGEQLQDKDVYTQNWGLLKSTMPVSQADIAFSEKVMNYLKPSDMTNFDESADWVIHNFDKLVHPFSNSISGTMLIQLRVLKLIQNSFPNDPGLFNVHFLSNYFKLMSSAMLLHSGGHSYYEFLTPITLDAVREAFSNIEGFDQLDMESVIYCGNEKAVNQAVDEASTYNRILLKRANVMSEIKNKHELVSNDELINGIHMMSEAIDTKYAASSHKSPNEDVRASIYDLSDELNDATSDEERLTTIRHFFNNPDLSEPDKHSFFSFLKEVGVVSTCQNLEAYLEKINQDLLSPVQGI